MDTRLLGKTQLKQTINRVRRGYAHGEPRPLGGYLVTLGGYGIFAGTLAMLVRDKRDRLPLRPPVADVVLAGISTHKLSRMLAKDPITSPLRAPVTRYEDSAGDAELHESVRGHGVAHAAGELVSCPFCLATWVATAITSGMVLLPRTTRFVCTVMTTVAASDSLQLGYTYLKKAAE